MVFVVGLLAAVVFGLGWVLQQRVAAHAALSELLSLRLLIHLMNKPVWWAGIAAMAVGSALGGLALQLGPLAVVEPLLSANLLFALIFAAAMQRARVRRNEVVGAILLSAALGVFIGVGSPHAAAHASVPPAFPMVGAAIIVMVVVGALLAVGRRRSLPVESALIAAAAGLVYGLQDVATRASLLDADKHGYVEMLQGPWPYAVVAAAVIGIWLSQNAFRAGRLDYSLPPTAAAEPITGIALGVAVLGDRVATSDGALAAQAACLVAVILGAVLIARSDSLAHASRPLRREHSHI